MRTRSQNFAFVWLQMLKPEYPSEYLGFLLTLHDKGQFRKLCEKQPVCVCVLGLALLQR